MISAIETHPFRAVLFTPFYIESTPIHDDVARPASPLRKTGCHSSGTSSRSASHRDTAATLPDSRADTSIGQHLCKFDVATLRKGSMMLKDFPCPAHLINIIGKNNVVRIAH